MPLLRLWLAGGAAGLLMLVSGGTAGAGAPRLTVDCGAGGNLQAAINAHQGSKAVLVVSGVCKGTFSIGRAITLQAGSAGATLDGGAAGPTLTIRSGQVVVQGLAITGGAGFRGGGIDNRGRLALSGVTVSGNRSEGFGGGIGNVGTLTVSGSTVSGNVVTNGLGGGLFNAGSLTVTASTIGGQAAADGNSAGYGGGILNVGTLTLNGSHVTGNTSTGPGGGIYSGGALTLASSTVNDNVADGNGGGILLANAGKTSATDSTISGNTSTSGSGGGIYLASSAATLTGTSITGNNSSSDGGGIADVGGKTSGLALSDSVVSGNTSQQGNGGGIVNEAFDGDSSIVLTGTTVADNTAPGPDRQGGGIANYSVGGHAASVELASSTLRLNRAGNGFGGNIANGAPTSGTTAASTLSMTGSQIVYGQALWGGGIYNNGRYAVATTIIGAGSSVMHNLAFTAAGGGGIYNPTDGTIVISPRATVSSNSPDDEADTPAPSTTPRTGRGPGPGGRPG
jgi:predicted outer membrane repeat protein